jgi:hypothetical protein
MSSAALPRENMKLCQLINTNRFGEKAPELRSDSNNNRAVVFIIGKRSQPVQQEPFQSFAPYTALQLGESEVSAGVEDRE